MSGKAITVNDFKKMKESGRKIAVLTAYDALFAALLDEAGIDMVLVGDSLGNVFQGHATTLSVTLDQMIYHGEIVARSVERAFVCIDMPFLTFQISAEEALRNAGEIMRKTGCGGVKLEGGVRTASTIRRIVETGIPVFAHVGLTPQSVHAFGGFGVRGRDDGERIIEDALAVEEAGSFAVVLEKIPRNLAAKITEKLSIPTIGIGAGPYCDGQVIVTPDMLGLFKKFKPSFVRRYAEIGDIALDSFTHYIEDVRAGRFPTDQESYE